MFDKVCGTNIIRIEFSKTFQVRDVRQLWDKDLNTFREKAKKILLVLKPGISLIISTFNNYLN